MHIVSNDLFTVTYFEKLVCPTYVIFSYTMISQYVHCNETRSSATAMVSVRVSSIFQVRLWRTSALRLGPTSVPESPVAGLSEEITPGYSGASSLSK